MFYKVPFDQIIRQGDIIEGLISFGAIVHNFFRDEIICGFDLKPSFSIDLRFNYTAVMTPCCTIRKATYISLCPLYPASKKIHKLSCNPYLHEYPTRINTPVPAEKCVPPDVWETKLPEDEKEKRQQKGRMFVYESFFVFKRYENIFKEDMIIDFNDTFSIRRQDLGNDLEQMLPSKVLQLTDETRGTFRQKLVKFYIRVPEEEEGIT